MKFTGINAKSLTGRWKLLPACFPATEREQFDAWVTRFGQVNLDASDPEGVSDRMMVTLNLFGSGDNSKPGKAEEQALLEWAQNLFQKLYS